MSLMWGNPLGNRGLGQTFLKLESPRTGGFLAGIQKRHVSHLAAWTQGSLAIQVEDGSRHCE